MSTSIYYSYFILIVTILTITKVTVISTVDFAPVEPPEKCIHNLQACPVDLKTMEKGDNGDMGERGTDGYPGLMGPPGIQGQTGQKGVQGMQGEPGARGSKGFVGPPASCYCPDKDKVEHDLLCNMKSDYSDEDDDESKTTVNVRPSNEFDVQCKTRPDKPELYATCLIKPPQNLVEEDLEKLSFKHGDKPSWLTIIERTNFNLTELYFGYTLDQLEYLQKHSSKVTQKIKYHCKNSFVTPVNKDEVPEKSLQLLSWKEHLIGPEATSENPFHYTVEDDSCKDSVDDWKYANIILKDNYRRLPILDFFIRDIRKGLKQQFYLELIELCFY